MNSETHVLQKKYSGVAVSKCTPFSMKGAIHVPFFGTRRVFRPLETVRDQWRKMQTVSRTNAKVGRRWNEEAAS